ncbi:sulfurtransferase TusA family protein [Brevundimonas balnearis]|uniref:Sulfurtransferase TusA family protein n=1 Tax=Brevundimonas balnearis TaxID=1572858 RepID=A0ABV6QZC8_9CAUL
MSRIIDARGHRCPVPSLRLRRALEEAVPGQIVTLLATDALARIDVPHMLAETGDRLIEIEAEGVELRISVEKRGAPGG